MLLFPVVPLSMELAVKMITASNLSSAHVPFAKERLCPNNTRIHFEKRYNISVRFKETCNPSVTEFQQMTKLRSNQVVRCEVTLSHKWVSQYLVNISGPNNKNMETNALKFRENESLTIQSVVDTGTDNGKRVVELPSPSQQHEHPPQAIVAIVLLATCM